jgi:sec-independent protein translocase protein TatB
MRRKWSEQMNFLGVGPGELVLILVIAVIVLGPDKIPETMRTIGKAMREIRAITEGFQKELNKELAEVTKEPATPPSPAQPTTQPAGSAVGDSGAQAPIVANAELPPPYGPATVSGSAEVAAATISDEGLPEAADETHLASEVNRSEGEPNSGKPSAPVTADRA